MGRTKFGGILAVVVASGAVVALAADSSGVEPLKRPRDLRELVFLTSGHGMAYGPARDPGGTTPPFTNVYVTPEAYRGFMASGVWPEGAMFFLEIRRGESHVSINAQGATQGVLLGLEASVKDRRRNPDGGWAYFDFGPGGRADTGTQQPRSASCYSCHSKHGAVEWTFTQFYPEQLAVAQAKGTVRKDYDPDVHAE
jgi:hypothetical protein